MTEFSFTGLSCVCLVPVAELRISFINKPKPIAGDLRSGWKWFMVDAGLFQGIMRYCGEKKNDLFLKCNLKTK